MSERRGTRPGWPCAQAAPPELVPGTIVGAGRFVVGGMLGRGGMATVYRGHDRQLGREVALKVMLGDAGDLDHRARARRFEHEAELVARLPAHPGLLQLLHAGQLPELEGRPFLATERVEGPTLAFRLATPLRMPSAHAVALGLGLAEGLAAAHGVGVVHRDLTARNIVVGVVGVVGPAKREGRADDDHDDHEVQPVIVDFGLAAVVQPPPGVARLTRLHQRPGTVTAMAPEQYRGAPAHPAMDVYALGRLLYQMLTGEDPHAAVSRTQLLACHRDGVRAAPRLTGGAEVRPTALGALVDACTEPAPSDRPTAEEVCTELRSIGLALQRGAVVIPFARAEPRAEPQTPCSEVDVVTVTRRPTVATRPVPRARRARRWITAGLVVGLAAGLAVGLAASSPGRPPQAVHALEPVAVAWPSTVVPLVRRPAVAPSPPASVVATPRASVSATASIERPEASPRPVRTRAACEEQRQRALAAARRWAWSEVLEATSEPRCWPEPSTRTRLRLVAWIEQQRFDACVTEGAEVRDPALARLVERCRQRLGGIP